LFTKRKGRSSFYFLSEAGMAIMKTGESRSVKRGPPSSWDGTFRMISYEIPESLRHERAALAETLRKAGLGRAAAGLWVSAYDFEDRVQEHLARRVLAGRVDRYLSEYSGDAKEFASRIWKLEERRVALDAFIACYSARRDEFIHRRESASALNDGECFTEYFEELGAFVEAMASVPPVPPELLPSDWPAGKANELFIEYRRLVHAGASDFFDSVYEPFD
ncbi:MAG: hypothetical protein E4H20_11870, partial [Spirochaetales bacterium]